MQPHLIYAPFLSHRLVNPEIRDYPKGLSAEEGDRLTSTCLSAISHCINLRSCVWTRDGSLTTPILKTLATCPQLKELTINGHSEGHYHPEVLQGLTRLKSLTIIMPSPAIFSLLPAWSEVLGQTLNHFSLICKVSKANSYKRL